MRKFVIRLVSVLMWPFRPWSSVGKENIPDGNAVVIANHSEALDPFFILFSYPKMLYVMAKKELFNIKPLAAVFKAFGIFPVDRSKNDIKAVKTSLSVLKGGDSLLLFPEGTRVKEGESVAAKNGAVMFAIKSRVPVLPVSLSGKHRLFSHTKVIYEKPVYLDEYYDKKLTQEEMSLISEKLLLGIRKAAKE